jgi:hypothetical protein
VDEVANLQLFANYHLSINYHYHINPLSCFISQGREQAAAFRVQHDAPIIYGKKQWPQTTLHQLTVSMVF